MSSHLRKRSTKDGYSWQIIVELDPDRATGKRNRIFKTIPDCPRKEAEAVMREILSDLDKKAFVRDCNITVEEYLKEWLETYIIPHKSPTTTKGYSDNLERYIIPKFGKEKLQGLTTIEIQKWYNQLAKESPCSRKPLSSKTIRNVHMNFNAALKRAVQLEIIQKNPAEYIELQKPKQYQAKIYNDEELHQLITKLRSSDIELGIMILICLGLRRGELMALKWDSIDYENNIVTISKNTVQVNGETYTKEPKTESSRRKIEAPVLLMKYLRKGEVDYKRRKLKHGLKYNDSSLVICQDDGTPYLPKHFSQKFKDFLKQNGLRHIRLHDLRHQNATMMLKMGICPKVAQKRLGHSNYSTTMDIYSHVLDDMGKEAAERLNEGLRGFVG